MARQDIETFSMGGVLGRYNILIYFLIEQENGLKVTENTTTFEHVYVFTYISIYFFFYLFLN